MVETTNEARQSPVPRVLFVLGIGVVLAMVVYVVVVVGARGGASAEPGRAEAEAFVAAWTAADPAAMARLATPPDAPVAADLDEALGSLPVTGTKATLTELTPLEGARDERRALVAIELTSPELPPITYTHSLPLVRIDEENWRVAWSRSAIHPALGDGHRFERITTWAPRGTLLAANGQPIAASPPEHVDITVRPFDVVDRPALDAALGAALGIDSATIDQAITSGSSAGAAVIKRVSWSEYQRVKADIYDIPGLSFPTSGGTRGMGGTAEQWVIGQLSAATAEQAAALGPPYREGDLIGVSGLQQSQQKTLGGLPATIVRIVDADGEEVQAILEVDGSPPTSVRTTIDPDIQRIAEDALGSSPAASRGGALVVIDRTGAIRAMANPPTGSGYDWATAQYPPGSTFKVVTTAALLSKGLRPDSPLTCPPTITAAGQPFRNFEGGSEPNLDFAKAFATSCNTAFIGAANQHLSGDEMRRTVEQFGFNVDYDLGIPMVVRGSFPNDGDGAALTSQAIGQGRVLTNPVHMASVAAAAMTGQWRAPTFLADRPEGHPEGAPLDAQVHQDLVALMRNQVETGSGSRAAVPGKLVHGKTGTAEQGAGDNPPTHAWFIGFSGDLAIAVVLNFGGVGGQVAAPVAGQFFSQVP
jgi:cell division protein FtsI/penicillin-binding protein 2